MSSEAVDLVWLQDMQQSRGAYIASIVIVSIFLAFGFDTLTRCDAPPLFAFCVILVPALVIYSRPDGMTTNGEFMLIFETGDPSADNGIGDCRPGDGGGCGDCCLGRLYIPEWAGSRYHQRGQNEQNRGAQNAKPGPMGAIARV